ncbi:MAG: hypothetical protein MZV70_42420 [Desulfobacterales bacterium]|nr:hypothetical protein [Desulfobacterales bacterium]
MDYIVQKRGAVLLALLFMSCMWAFPEPLHAGSQCRRGLSERQCRIRGTLIRDADKKRDRVSWMAVIHKFQNVAKELPRSSYAPKAWFKVGKLYEDLNRFSSSPKDLEKAVDAYMTVADMYPSKPACRRRSLYSPPGSTMKG